MEQQIMRIKEVPVYTYDEHPDKEKVLEKMGDINTSFEWYDNTLSDWKERLEKLGYNDTEISFSGFYSQGDGASFTAKGIDLVQWLKSHKKKTAFRRLLRFIELDELSARVIRTSHHYSHSNTVEVEMDIGFPEIPVIHSMAEVLEELISEEVKKLSDEIYSDLEKECEYLESEEAIVETIKANEYEFELDGSIA